MIILFSDSTGFVLALIFYIAATFLFCLSIVFDKKIISTFGFRFTLAGFIAHLLFFILYLNQHGAPYLTSSFETYQIISGSVLLVFLILGTLYKFLASGAFLVPIGLLFYILSMTRWVAFKTPEHFLVNPWAFVHLVFIFIGLAIFMVSFVVGLLYFLQEYCIKHKKIGGFLDRLPSLEAIEQIHHKSLYIGFILFTFGIITGGGWSKSISGYYISADFKQLASMGLWIFFAIFLNLRVSRGWVGHKGVLLSTIGFIAAIFLLTWVQI